MDAEQQTFAEDIGEYGAGSFWATFADVGDLQAKVADALCELAARPGQLDFQALSAPVDVVWRAHSASGAACRSGAGQHGRAARGAAEPSLIPARLRRAMPDRLVGALRRSAAVPAHAGLDPRVDHEAAAVRVPGRPRQPMGRFAAKYPRRLVRVSTGGRDLRVVVTACRATAWAPSSTRASSLKVAQALRLAGIIRLPDAARFGVAIGVSRSLISLVNGALPQSGRYEHELRHHG